MSTLFGLIAGRSLSLVKKGSLFPALRTCRAVRQPFLSGTQIFFTPKRFYCQSTNNSWSSDDLKQLGSYIGKPTPRGQFKTTTGYVGEKPIPKGREILIELYKRLVIELEKLPNNYAYRVDMEAMIQRHMHVLRREDDIFRIEEEIEEGPIEELIQAAEIQIEQHIPNLLTAEPWTEPPNKWTNEIPLTYSNVATV